MRNNSNKKKKNSNIKTKLAKNTSNNIEHTHETVSTDIQSTQEAVSNKKTLMQLFWPCFFEVLFLMLAGMIDTFMLSALNDKAVGAVGTTSTYLGFLVMMFSIISTGMVAVMTQYIGAGKPYIAKQARDIGLVLNLILGVILSLVLGIFAKDILMFMGIAPSLLGYATTYMKIIGGSSIIIAILPIYNSYMRSFGHTKEPMYATIIANVLNLVLNAVFLFILNMGVAGVAIATVISKVVNLIIIMFYSSKTIHVEKPDTNSDNVIISNNINNNNSNDNVSNNIANTVHDPDITNNIYTNKFILKQIIRIGIPAAAESALYELTITIIIMLLNQMDPDGINVTARAYVATITNFSYCAGLALASANCILIGWNIGKKDYKKCYTDTAKTLKYGSIVALTVSLLLFIFAKPLLGLFTTDATIIKLSTALLLIDIFLELGRVANLVFANALKTTGDSIYIVVVASIVMLLVGAGGTYILGIKLELFAIGAYISMALDEIVRAIISYFRFNSKKWEKKTLV